MSNLTEEIPSPWSKHREPMVRLSRSILQDQVLSQLLRNARRHNGMSQRELADLCGVSQSSISRLENDASKCKVSLVAQACRKLGLDLYGPRTLRAASFHDAAKELSSSYVSAKNSGDHLLI